jgi:hypothetical protein
LALITAITGVSLIYATTHWVEFHQNAFGAIAALVFANAYHMKSKKPGVYVERIGWSAVASFLLGYFFWNLDNYFCMDLRQWRSDVDQWINGWAPSWVGPVLAELVTSLSQFHAIWHILTGLSGYLAVCYFQAARAREGIFDSKCPRGHAVELRWWLGFFPYCTLASGKGKRASKSAELATPLSERKKRR